jgi:nucleotide-binding universal stress UspA family protein
VSRPLIIVGSNGDRYWTTRPMRWRAKRGVPILSSSDKWSEPLDPGEALLKLGRPTLVVPESVSSLSADHVVIGWKDTREARRVVQDGLPFFHEASHVTVVEICEPDEESAAKQHIDDVVRYLVRHRVKASPRVILRQDGSAADQIVTLAREEDADLIVTGAYGHTRLGEWMFGGVTRDLLANSSVCCLMSH